MVVPQASERFVVLQAALFEEALQAGPVALLEVVVWQAEPVALFEEALQVEPVALLEVALQAEPLVCPGRVLPAQKERQLLQM